MYVALAVILLVVGIALFSPENGEKIIYIKREKAQNAFDINDMISAKNNLFPIATYLIPINIILGIIAIFLGITLRGL